MRYLSLQQIKASLQRLEPVSPLFGTSFLAFKSIQLPLGRTTHAVFSQVVDAILARHYRASSRYEGFYNPFRTSKGQERWVSPRWSSTTLQRLTSSSLADALLHPHGSSEWGWKVNYVEVLGSHLQGRGVPAFDLAVWLFRGEAWPEGVTAEQVRDRLYQEYSITARERQALFDDQVTSLAEPWLGDEPVAEARLLEVIGEPPSTPPDEGVTLRHLEVVQVGLAEHFEYEPGEHLNLITGDNSLGKTFLLECIWWALTGRWPEGLPLLPRPEAEREEPRIRCTLAARDKPLQELEYHFEWERSVWRTGHSEGEARPGVVVYARHDGSFAVWDPMRAQLEQGSGAGGGEAGLLLRSDNVWQGLDQELPSGRKKRVCNGLLHDWVLWQRGGPDHERAWRSLTACIQELSPSPREPLAPGRGRRLPLDAREFPTVVMPYGEILVTHASAGVKRMLALAYMLVWAWDEYERNCELTRSEPQHSLVLLIDEVEAHLHPRWQRVIVSALLGAVSQLASGGSPQIHLATHSPLVLASAEPFFNEERDSLYHLRLDEEQPGRVLLERLDFTRQGRVDRWLTSEVFGLGASRSREAEQAIEQANALQRSETPPAAEAVKAAHERLRQVLAEDDEYWHRWRYFARSHGAGA